MNPAQLITYKKHIAAGEYDEAEALFKLMANQLNELYELHDVGLKAVDQLTKLNEDPFAVWAVAPDTDMTKSWWCCFVVQKSNYEDYVGGTPEEAINAAYQAVIGDGGQG